MIEQYLERLFTWESLENTPRGVEFELKNRLADADLHGVTLLQVDGESVPLDEVVVEREDGTTLRADEVSEDDPLEFELADTVQVVADHERLRLGTHELTVGLVIERFGAVSFTTTDEVVEADLMDVDPADYTVEELRSLVGAVTEPTTLAGLRERERDGEGRKTALQAIQSRLETVEGSDVGAGVEPSSSGADPTGIPLLDGLDDLVVDVLESPKHVSVYTATQLADGGSAEEIARDTLLAESVVEETLEDLLARGSVERTDEGYEARPPTEVLRNRGLSVMSLIGLGS